MKWVDLIVIVLLLILVSTLVYFLFIKHRGDHCYNCPYHRNCDKRKCLTNNKEEKK